MRHREPSLRGYGGGVGGRGWAIVVEVSLCDV